MRRSCHCFHHAVSTVRGDTLGRKEATQFPTLVFQCTLLEDQSLCRYPYFIRAGPNMARAKSFTRFRRDSARKPRVIASQTASR
ncbi:unnamed protein product [Prunus armeniaca]